MYTFIGKFTATPGNAQALAERLANHATAEDALPGSIQYLIYTEGEDTVWVAEIWESKEAHDASLEIAGVRDFIRETMPLIAAMDAHQVELVGGYGPGITN